MGRNSPANRGARQSCANVDVVGAFRVCCSCGIQNDVLHMSPDPWGHQGHKSLKLSTHKLLLTPSGNNMRDTGWQYYDVVPRNGQKVMTFTAGKHVIAFTNNLNRAPDIGSVQIASGEFPLAAVDSAYGEYIARLKQIGTATI
jgi:hypothetical protein